jgi:PIN domain nuclease of toxin-antitoxin system
MRYLLDSHALLWFLEGGEMLTPRVRAVLSDERNRILVSPASVYELRYKSARGRMRELPYELREIFEQIGFEELPITVAAADAAAQLPLHLRDPWDRMLAAQAIETGSVLVSRDDAIKSLGVQTIW